MLSGAVPRIYERWWRPALGRMFKGMLGPGMADEHRIARLLLALSPGDGVLDVACGTGNFSRDFARSVGAAGLVVGIDVSETMLTRAVEDTRKGGLANTAYVRGDAQELPFLDASFDAVCCFAALYLIEEPYAAIAEIARVLAPGGRVALLSSVARGPVPAGVTDALVRPLTGVRMFGRDDLTRALSSHGLADVRLRVTGFAQFVSARRR